MRFNSKKFFQILLLLEIIFLAGGCAAATWVTAVDGMLARIIALAGIITTFIGSLESKGVDIDIIKQFQEWKDQIERKVAEARELITQFKAEKRVEFVTQLALTIELIESLFEHIEDILSDSKTATAAAIAKARQFLALGLSLLNSVIAIMPATPSEPGLAAPPADLRDLVKQANEATQRVYAEILTDITLDGNVNDAVAQCPKTL